MNFAKKYAKVLKVIDDKATLTLYERNQIVNELNLIIDKLIAKQEEVDKELEEFKETGRFDPMKVKYMGPAFVISLAVALVSGIVFKHTQANEALLLMELSVFAHSIAQPLFAVAVVNDGSKAHLLKQKQSLSEQKQIIQRIQKNYKSFRTGTDNSISMLEEECSK